MLGRVLRGKKEDGLMNIPPRSSSKRSAMFLLVFGVCMVSYSGPMVKGALLAGATPVAIALVRMASAGLILLPSLARAITKNRLPSAINPGQWLWVTLAALFLAGHYLTWITSLTGTSTFASVALVCTQPLFVAFFSYLLFGETIPQKALPGAILALAGAALIALSGSAGDGNSLSPDSAGSPGQGLTSNLLALSGAVLMAAHWLTARHVRGSLPAQVYTPVLYLITALILACSLPLMGSFSMPLAALPYMAGLVLGSTLLGHAMLSRTLSQVSAGVVSFALLAEPVGAMVFAMIIFHEIPSSGVLAGGGLTLLGLSLYLSCESRRRRIKQEGTLSAHSEGEPS